MNKRSFITVLIVAHVGALLMLIDKQNRFVRSTYDIQRAQRYKQELTSSMHELQREIAQIENKESILAYAQKQGMQQIALKQIRKIS